MHRQTDRCVLQRTWSSCAGVRGRAAQSSGCCLITILSAGRSFHAINCVPRNGRFGATLTLLFVNGCSVFALNMHALLNAGASRLCGSCIPR